MPIHSRTGSPVAVRPAQSPTCVPVMVAISKTPWGPMTMSVRSKWTSGKAVRKPL